MALQHKTRLQRIEELQMLQLQTSANEHQIENLKASCAFSLSILESANLAIIATDLDGKIIFLNRQAEQLFGRSEKNILNDRLTRMFIKASHQNIETCIKTAARGASWSGEIIMRRTDYTPLTVEIRSSPLENIQGDIVGMVGIYTKSIEPETDTNQILEKDRLLAAYHQMGLNIVSTLDQDEILDHLAQQIMDAGLFRSLLIALVNEEENALTIVREAWRDNPLKKLNIKRSLDAPTDHTCLAAQRKEMLIFGFLDQQPFDTGMFSKSKNKIGFFIPVMQKEKVVAVLATACAVEHQEEIQHRIEVMRPLLDQVAIALEKAQLYKSIQLRIAEREKAEKTLRESEERYRLLVESAPVCIHEIDLQGNLISMNQKGLELMGVEHESAICGLFYLDVIADEDRDRIEALLNRACQGYPSHFQFKTKDKNNPLLFESSFIPIKDNNGTVTKLMGVTQNLTERIRLEEELRRVQNLDALGILAGGIAHDFNNVLTGVIGNLGMLEMNTDQNSDAYKFVTIAKYAANKAKDLTQQLMTFSKGGLPVKESASLAELIRETTTLCLRGSNTKPQYHLAPDLHTVEVDKSQIGQVIQNLVINADQAMSEGGVLSISANNTFLNTENTMGLREGKYVRVIIKDQGTGIPQHVLRKIFDPYFTTKEAGHGLGLAISYSIINKHDGYISAASKPGSGSTFEFYLPASKAEITPSTQNLRSLTQGTGKILVMDDEKMVRDVLSTMLVTLGYEVELAQDGEEALKKYQSSLEAGTPYNVVIMDLTIPGGMGGQEAITQLKAMHAEALVIVSSGYSQGPVMAQYKEYGFDAMLQKPITIENLSDVLQQVK